MVEALLPDGFQSWIRLDHPVLNLELILFFNSLHSLRTATVVVKLFIHHNKKGELTLVRICPTLLEQDLLHWTGFDVGSSIHWLPGLSLLCDTPPDALQVGV